MAELISSIDMLAIRLLVDLTCVFVLVWGVYLPRRSSRDFAFTCVMLNIVTFGLAWLMNRVPMDIGFGLGMFAIFGILRYRTEALRIRDLTYLFVCIGMAVVNGVEDPSITWASVILLDTVTITVVAILETLDARAQRETIRLNYDRIDLLSPAERPALLADLEARLKVPCSDVDIRTIDLLRETAEVWVTVEKQK